MDNRSAGFKRLKSVVKPASCGRRSGDASNERRGEEAAAPRKRRKKPSRPGYGWFLAIAVSDAEVRSRMAAAQETMLKATPEFGPAAVPASKAHVTLFMLNLDRDGRVDARLDEVCDSVRGAVDDYIATSGGPMTMRLSGVDRFGSGVIYVKTRFADGDGSDARFARLRESLGNRLRDDGFIGFNDASSFTPHVTLMKTSRVRKSAAAKGVPRAFPKAVHEPVADMDFGNQTVSSVQLLSMRKPQDKATGYYFCHKEFSIAGSPHCSSPDVGSCSSR